MKATKLILALLLLGAAGAGVQAQNRMPAANKWLNNNEVAFTYDGSFTDAFTVNTKGNKWKVTEGVQAPEKYADFPLKPEGAVNLTYSPDSTKLAFTRANDLWVVDIASGKETRLTFDGTETVMSGYASWVYYEEILGRPSRYRAFWGAPTATPSPFITLTIRKFPCSPSIRPSARTGASGAPITPSAENAIRR